MNALGALGRDDAKRHVRQRLLQAFENHLREVPEDARARILRAGMYAQEGRVEDSVREANLAMVLRPNEATVLYNAACTFADLGKRAECARRAAEGVECRLQGRRLDAARSRSRAPPRRPGVREALPRSTRGSVLISDFACIARARFGHSRIPGA